MFPISKFATEKVLKAMMSLKADPDWQVVNEWLDSTFGKMAINFVKDVTLGNNLHYIMQGKCLAMWELRAMVDRARDILEDMKIKEAEQKASKPGPGDIF